MVTSRCETDEIDERLRLPADATPAETAAIAAAIAAHLRDQEAAGAVAATAGDGETWDGSRWQFAGRTEGLSGVARRAPHNAPTDDWTAAGRLEGLR
jgi:hypothetical protein